MPTEVDRLLIQIDNKRTNVKELEREISDINRLSGAYDDLNKIKDKYEKLGGKKRSYQDKSYRTQAKDLLDFVDKRKKAFGEYDKLLTYERKKTNKEIRSSLDEYRNAEADLNKILPFVEKIKHKGGNLGKADVLAVESLQQMAEAYADADTKLQKTLSNVINRKYDNTNKSIITKTEKLQDAFQKQLKAEKKQQEAEEKARADFESSTGREKAEFAAKRLEKIKAEQEAISKSDTLGKYPQLNDEFERLNILVKDATNAQSKFNEELANGNPLNLKSSLAEYERTITKASNATASFNSEVRRLDERSNLINSMFSEDGIGNKRASWAREQLQETNFGISQTDFEKILNKYPQLTEEYHRLQIEIYNATYAQKEFNSALESGNKDKLPELLKKYESSAQKATKAFENFNNQVIETKKANNVLLNAISGVDNGLSSIKKKLKGLNIGKWLMYVAFARRIFDLFNRIVKSSSDWVENLNLLEVTFAETTDKALEFIDTMSYMTGLDVNDFAQYTATFKQMANAMGQVSETGEKMAEVLTMVATDVASLRNVSIEKAATDLASGISGQVKPVRKYGFDITQYSIEDLFEKEGIKYAMADMTQAQKQLARTVLLVRQSRDAWGDLVKTINTYANQLKVLQAQFNTFTRLAGNIVLGSFEFNDTLEEAKKSAGSVTVAIWYVNGAFMALNALLSAIVPSVENLNDELANTTKQYSDIEDAINGSLLSFDKFESLNPNDNGLGIAGLTKQLEDILSSDFADYTVTLNKRLDETQQFAQQIALDLLKWAFPELSGFDNFRDTVKYIKETFTRENFLEKASEDFSKIASIYINIGKIGKIIFNAKNIETLLRVLEVMLPIIEQIVLFLTNLADGFSKMFGNATSICILFATVGLAKITIWIVKTMADLKRLGLDVTKFFKKATLDQQIAVNTGIAENGKYAASLQKIGLAITSLFAGFGIGMGIISAFSDEMKNTVSIIVSVTGALLGLAGAILLIRASAKGVQSVIALPMLMAGLGLAISGIIGLSTDYKSKMSVFANGGYQTGGYFYAGEKGAEWVGSQGRTSTIINDNQMSDIMTASVARGIILGNAQSQPKQTGNGDVYLDGRKVGIVIANNDTFRNAMKVGGMVNVAR